MAQPINQQQPQTNQPQPIGLKVNATLRTKEGLYLPKIEFRYVACKFLVLKATYVNGSNPKQDCYLTANFTTQGERRGITLHVFDALNAQNWRIDNWSKSVKTSLNINKLRQPTPDEVALIEKLKENEKETGIGLRVFWKNPTVVEAAYSLNNPQTGTNSANKQNQIDNGMGSKPKQPSAAVQGAIEGMSEKNPALESTNIIFDRIIRESHNAFNILMHQAYESGYNYASDTVEDDDSILCKDEEMRPIFDEIFDEDDDMLFKSWKEGYKKYVCQFLEIDHSVDYDSDYIHESVESDKEEFTNYVNNLFNDTGHMEIGKCPDCGMMLTDEDELEDGTHECPKCGSILEDHEDNDIDFWDEPDDEPDFWEIEDEDC